MAEFSTDQQILKQPYPFLDMDPNMEFTNNILESTSSIFHYIPTLNFHTPMSLFNENQFPQSQDFPGNLAENFSGNFQPKGHYQTSEAVSQPIITPKNDLKRKAISVSESSSGICSSLAISDSRSKRKNSSGRGKRRKIIEEEEEKPKEVVHVRARRGQATDSHSLAERVRRSRINERLRCLQDIVPGCYKTMGLAVMLDEIINYVQSLQSQVEFLSMKLTAASSYYDFNSESDVVDRLQRAKANEVKELERLMKEGHGAQANFHTTWQT